jgi:hypothetical protein
MSQTQTSTGEDAASGDRGGASKLSEAAVHRRRHGVVWWVLASVLCLLALVILAGGGWALWMDRIERDGSGYVSVGTTELDTGTYAIISELRGDGPGWLYGSTLLGKARVRATSQSDEAVFIGVARTSDVSRYLDGVGYATIEHFATGELSSTHEGGAPASPPAELSIWAASTEGTGEQTLVWKPRDGDWSIVLMNTDASAGVTVNGELAAKFPPLPWVAAGLLIAGAVLAVVGGWLLVSAVQGAMHRPESGQSPGPMSPRVQVGR